MDLHVHNFSGKIKIFCSKKCRKIPKTKFSTATQINKETREISIHFIEISTSASLTVTIKRENNKDTGDILTNGIEAQKTTQP